jgi:hypothetical protein
MREPLTAAISYRAAAALQVTRGKSEQYLKDERALKII